MPEIQTTSKKGTLLIVDDEEDILQALKRQFRKTYDVYIANGAIQAYEIMNQIKADVIISDQRMPEITGTEFFAHVKKEYPNCIRIILTAYSDIKSVIDAINQGSVFRYITKPWESEELNNIIEQAFNYHYLIRQKQELLEEISRINRSLEDKIILRTAELEKANLKLMELDRKKTEFLNMVAHDLRNPLNGIIGLSQIMIDDPFIIQHDDFKENLDIILSSSEYMLNLLNNILDINKIKKGQLYIKPEPINVSESIADIIKINKIIGEKKGITINCSIEPDLPPILFDRACFKQVLNNLIVNAFKFSKEGTSVTISASKQNDMVDISVTDQGIGMTKNDIVKIFENIDNVTNQGTAGETGYGLGLAISKKIIDAHHGSLDIVSEINKGSKVLFKVKTC